MKILIAYYSRTGLTKKIASLISARLESEGFTASRNHSIDMDEIVDAADRAGAVGYMKAGKDAMQNKLTSIVYTHNPKEYDLVLIGGPVWAWTVTPAIRTYIDKNIDALKVKRLAFFATQSSSGAEKKFDEMKKLLGVKPAAELIINGKDFRTEEHKRKVDEFVEKLK